MIPVVVTSWPTILPVLRAAAGALGFGRVKKMSSTTEERGGLGMSSTAEESAQTASVTVKNGEFVTEGMAEGTSLVVTRGDVRLTFRLDRKGKCQVEAFGAGMSKVELQRLAEKAAGKVVQMYAYHKLVTEAKNQGFVLVEETTDLQGAIRLRLRRF